MNEINKSYYAIIPADVRYNDKLSANAKLLYGEITALCNTEGYCWATNEYFSNLYGVSSRTVQNWLKELSDSKQIRIEMIYHKNTKEIKRRAIYLGGEKNFVASRKKVRGGGEKNFVENNTYINNTHEYISNTNTNNTNTNLVKANEKEKSVEGVGVDKATLEELDEVLKFTKISKHNKEQIISFLKNGMEVEVINDAIRITNARTLANWDHENDKGVIENEEAYIMAILRNWNNFNVRTLEDVKKYNKLKQGEKLDGNK